MVNGMSREETITVVSAKNLSLLSSTLCLPCDCTLSFIRVIRFKLIGTLLEVISLKYKRNGFSGYFLFERNWPLLASLMFGPHVMNRSTCFKFQT